MSGDKLLVYLPARFHVDALTMNIRPVPGPWDTGKEDTVPIAAAGLSGKDDLFVNQLKIRHEQWKDADMLRMRCKLDGNRTISLLLSKEGRPSRVGKVATSLPAFIQINDELTFAIEYAGGRLVGLDRVEKDGSD